MRADRPPPPHTPRADGALPIRRRAVALLGKATAFADRVVPLLEAISRDDPEPSLRADAARYAVQLRAASAPPP